MDLGVRLGVFLLTLSFTTAIVLFWRSTFSPLTFLRTIGIWTWSDWSFDAHWISRRQLAAFTILYAAFGGALVFNVTAITVLIGVAMGFALLLTLADRRVARQAEKNGVPDTETQHLSQWWGFNARKAHEFTRHVEDGDIKWVPSTLTVLSVPLFVLAIGLFWVVMANTYPESIWTFAVVSVLTVGIPPILTCMVGPTPPFPTYRE